MIEKKISLQQLMTMVNDHKKERFAQIMNYRTRYITVAVEDVYQSQNASAIIRSCEIFGLQDIHLIEQRNRFVITKGVSMGAAKWMSSYRYQSTIDCVKNLKEQGYFVYAATPSPDAISLYDVAVDRKIALLFGAERLGLSQSALEHADGCVTIPMYGFTQSFNVSVSVALCLQYLMMQLHARPKSEWQLTEVERDAILYEWVERMLFLQSWVDAE